MDPADGLDIVTKPATPADGPAQAVIRPARPEDAPDIAEMCNALNVEHGKPDGLYHASLIEKDAFGPNRAFDTILATLDNRTVGYVSFQPFYNSDLAGRGIWVIDLFVHRSYRKQGLGKRLLAAVAATAVTRGATSLWWGVLTENDRARAFYDGLKVRDENARILELDEQPLQALAAEAPGRWT